MRGEETMKERDKKNVASLMESQRQPSDVINAQFIHPFTCIVAGPTGCGKSTFVKTFLSKAPELVDKPFDYIFVFLGTDKEDNETLASLQQTFSGVAHVRIFEVNKLYADKKGNFSHDLHEILAQKHLEKERGCIIFDDLMREMTEHEILMDLFTKHSSHLDVTVVNITQNAFHHGKRATSNMTLFRNTHVLVLFDSPLDVSPIRLIASRMGMDVKKMISMVRHVVQQHRYIIIRGDLKTDPRLRFTSDIFSGKMRAFHLKED